MVPRLELGADHRRTPLREQRSWQLESVHHRFVPRVPSPWCGSFPELGLFTKSETISTEQGPEPILPSVIMETFA